MTASKLVLNAASGAGSDTLDIDNVFRTFLYDGNAGTQTITNGIDLSGEGGLVWTKSRTNGAHHELTDTVRGGGSNGNAIRSNGTEAQGLGDLESFTSSGFVMGYNSGDGNASQDYVSWTFRKAEKFFDIVTYTGDGSSSRMINHNLGCEVGFIMAKRTDNTGDWMTYHRAPSSNGIIGPGINENGTPISTGVNTHHTTTQFKPSMVRDQGNTDANQTSGATYVAYLFAHNNSDGEFGPDSDQDIIKFGDYTGNGSTTGPTVDLGFEPQWLMLKRTDTGGAGYSWFIFDAMRGMPVGQADRYLSANDADTEAGSSERFKINATGFQLASTSGSFNASGGTYIYMAIRRGPLNVPDDASKVFHVDEYANNSNSNTYTTGFDVDMNINTRTGASTTYLMSRLTNDYYQLPETAGAASNPTGASNLFSQKSNVMDLHSGWWGATTDVVSWSWRRAPSYFDEVNYDGNGSARTIAHNLDAAPEMMWVKRTSSTEDWTVYHTAGGVNKYYQINSTGTGGTSSTAGGGAANIWNGTTPTSSVFSIGTHARVNTNGQTYSAWLFATAPGVSKVGYYTGSSGTVDVDCGFSNGAKFILIKLVSHSGYGWYVFDSQRGIVAGNDPHLRLNESTGSEVTSTDAIDPLSSGFQVTVPANAGTGINANGYVYIFYAIAA